MQHAADLVGSAGVRADASTLRTVSQYVAQMQCVLGRAFEPDDVRHPAFEPLVAAPARVPLETAALAAVGLARARAVPPCPAVPRGDAAENVWSDPTVADAACPAPAAHPWAASLDAAEFLDSFPVPAAADCDAALTAAVRDALRDTRDAVQRMLHAHVVLELATPDDPSAVAAGMTHFHAKYNAARCFLVWRTQGRVLGKALPALEDRVAELRAALRDAAAGAAASPLTHDIARACTEEDARVAAFCKPIAAALDASNQLHRDAIRQMPLKTMQQRLDVLCAALSAVRGACTPRAAAAWPPELAHFAARVGRAAARVEALCAAACGTEPVVDAAAVRPCVMLKCVGARGALLGEADAEQRLAALGPAAWTGAGVLVFEHESVLAIVDIDATLRDAWIGGRRDAADASWFDTACREFDEETLVRGHGLRAAVPPTRAVLMRALLAAPHAFFGATIHHPKYAPAPPYVVLCVHLARLPPALQAEFRELPARHAALDFGRELRGIESPMVHLEQRGFAWVAVDTLPPELRAALGRGALRHMLKSPSSFPSSVSAALRVGRRDIVRHAIAEDMRRATRGAARLTAGDVEAWLDDTAPLPAADPVLEAAAALCGGAVGRIGADGARAVFGAGELVAWVRESVEGEVAAVEV